MSGILIPTTISIGGALLLLTALYAQAQDGQTIRADLAFHFDCKAEADPPSDGTTERFLEKLGFRVLNKVRLARQQRVMHPFTLDIVAIDDQRREITFMGFPTSPGTYSVGFYSPPPTRHSTELEDALLTFVSSQLGCSVRQIERHENGEEVRSFYDKLFKIREGWFQQAEDMTRPPL